MWTVPNFSWFYNKTMYWSLLSTLFLNQIFNYNKENCIVELF